MTGDRRWVTVLGWLLVVLAGPGLMWLIFRWAVRW